MAITAADIHNQSFSIDRKGYDVDEVDVFLEHVAEEIDLLNDQIDHLEQQLDDSAFAGFDAPAAPVEDDDQLAEEPAESAFDVSGYEDALAEKDAVIADLERQLADKKADDSAIAQALIIAQRSADEILAKANAQASETIQDAREEAQRIVDRANNDRQDVVEAIRKLQDDREDAREEYADLLKDIIEDATRKLASIGAVVAPAAAVHAYAASQVVPEPQVELLDGQMTDGYGFEGFMDAEDEPLAYTTPQTADSYVAAATPVASAYEKDLSGFGDADEFEFEEID